MTDSVLQLHEFFHERITLILIILFAVEIDTLKINFKQKEESLFILYIQYSYKIQFTSLKNCVAGLWLSNNNYVISMRDRRKNNKLSSISKAGYIT